jgi:hypothetical protein
MMSWRLPEKNEVFRIGAQDRHTINSGNFLDVAANILVQPIAIGKDLLKRH